MRPLDWTVLCAFLGFIVTYGVWKGRKSNDLSGYILADRQKRWWTIAFSIMATQASAITFLSTPGQAYADGMRFIQFYLGLPLAMVILSITAVPIYHRLGVYTAYEYLERRFDVKTRTVASIIFLIQRGLACGLTIYAPALILSILLGWNLLLTNFAIGTLVIVYTGWGGTRAVDHTNVLQMIVMLTGLATAFVIALSLLPPDITILEAGHVAGHLGRLNAIDFSFDLQNRYNFWSGLIGGCFVALAYFGTDQSQVGRYLGGQTVAQSRLGLLFNGMIKVPMQFFILLVGIAFFVFYQFVTPPLFFNSVEVSKARSGAYATEWTALEGQHQVAATGRAIAVKDYVQALRSGQGTAVGDAGTRLTAAQDRFVAVRTEAIDVIKKTNPKADTSDTNYVLLSFVLAHMPAGLIGLVLAAVFAGSMSSTSAELNALGSTTVIDIYQRLFRRNASDRHYVIFSKLATVFWGGFAILVAGYASRLGSLIEAVNILGSLFYGTVLGLFLLAFYVPFVRGTAAFISAFAGEAAVILCWRTTEVSWLWYNVVGCTTVVVVAMLLSLRHIGDARTEA